MVINEELLLRMGASIIKFNQSEIIFSQGNYPNFYYQIKKGEVKLNNYNEDGKEFIQNIFTLGHSFAESLLFINKPYPMNAVALTDCEIIRLSKDHFLRLLELYPKVSLQLNKYLSDRLYYKYIMLKNNSSLNPQTRLSGLLDYLKSFQENKSEYSFEIPLTRQQLASLTGLCVETAIRTIKNMERRKMLKIKNRKIYY
ncbi:Crp/Fnr family transcriptional regulator [Elizabethkingia occulta]|uniref:Crp/Fnr family transcriptional regulator n=1 Tax=Elizabethkingia occulta TaxID=1867263 RepID=UPI00099A9A45|nr:Crp/Fnr family transcriptional regulator [Elizabethkingia occulta]OPB92558.1 cyclic nucleotide-binding protein [Elizabethkingia occulta]